MENLESLRANLIQYVKRNLPRGEEMPVVDCYKTANLPAFKTKFPNPSEAYQPVLIMEIQEGKPFALPVDDLDFTSAFHTIKGVAVPTDAAHPFAELSRLAWDAVAGGQLVFLDWEKFSQQSL